MPIHRPSANVATCTPVFLLLFYFILCLFVCNPRVSQARQVTLPLTLEFPLLASLVKKNGFTGPDETVQLMDTSNGCNELRLSNPAMMEQEKRLYFSAELFIRLGIPLGESCLLPFNWEGELAILQEPILDEATWQLQFRPLEVHLLKGGKPALTITQKILEQIIPELEAFWDDISIDLVPPVQHVQEALIPLFTKEARDEARVMLDNLRPGEVQVTSDGLSIQLVTRLNEASPEKTPPTPPLGPDEQEEIIAVWEALDSFLIHLISLLTKEELTEDEKDMLINIILETRYNFIERIQADSLERDFVREQFISSWQNLAPLFRHHFLKSPGEDVLSYLSFITAADALSLLDDIGHDLGIEISKPGLLRLMDILQKIPAQLEYTQELHLPLIDLFKSSPPPPSQEPQEQETEKTLLNKNSFLDYLELILCPPAYANSPSLMEIKKWQAPKNDQDTFLNNVRELLDNESSSFLSQSELPSHLHPFYKELIPAIAWQESCFRQFIVKNRKLTYLLSYNNTSVGIMQVNERVWRGIYDKQRLRWDIRYNVFAGCEIAALYLRKYVLPKSDAELLKNHDLVAKILYAMYNGGPRQYGKYLKRKNKSNLYKSDKLFAEKYDWVKKGDWQKSVRCL